MRNVVIGMSGGVDSAVSAYLLKKAGYNVTGLFMKNWEDDDDSEYCSSRQDFIDAASAADVIGIDLEAVNFAKEYKERVFSDFLREYSAGRTPNPDVLCNAEIKFKAFLDEAMRMGADHIATGHYAQVRETENGFELLRGTDPGKDQSYFLHRLNQSQLSKAVFPVGAMYKKDVRRIAREIGLPVAAKKDSTGICFIGERPFREFLNRYLPTEPGPIKTPDGRTVGRHMGLAFYTLGQRKGLGIGGSRDGNGEPWFVAGKDLKTNTLIVVQGHDDPRLLTRALTAVHCSWVSGKAPLPGDPVTVKTRLGWSADNLIITTLAEQLQDCGIQALTIHGRTRAQMYTGEADWSLIGEVKRNPRIHIPIIGNGDITTPEQAKEAFERYGVDAVMVGRATFGRPWIFKEMRDYLDGLPADPSLDLDHKIDILEEQLRINVERIDEYRGILHTRRHLAASPIFKGIPDFRQTRIAMLRAETVEELTTILEDCRVRLKGKL